MEIDQLEIQHKKLEAILVSVSEAIILVDLDRKIVEFNPSAERLTGYSHAEAIGHPVEKILRFFDFENKQELPPETYCPNGNIEKEGVVCSRGVLTLIDSDGNNRSVSLISRKIRYGPEADISCILILGSVFEQEELERMKLDFVGMSEHILRTPITLLRGNLYNLFSKETLSKLGEKEAEELTKVVASVNELKDLVENLLSLSEISRGKLTLDMAKTSIEELVKRAMSELQESADEKGIKLSYIPPLYHIPLVKVDIVKMLEVLRNLLGNAVKYTKQGSVTVDIQTSDSDVTVSIKDTGMGIPARNIPHLFSKFYRVKKPLEMEAGQGLSLFVSKKIIEAHGGKIWVESREGIGSTFCFTLPR